MQKVAVIGLGNIGRRVLWELHNEGLEVVGVDSRLSVVEEVRSMLGVDVRIADALSRESMRVITREVEVVATALPSSISYRVISELVELGVSVVDVSFFTGDLEELRRKAEKIGVTTVIDAGVAPGLSNILVARGVKMVDGRVARVYVGGITDRPDPPLGWVATWSTHDLVEEYLRPARMIKGGSLVEVDPLEAETGEIEFPGVGRLQYFPTDGLRTMLETFSWLEELVEYTLRWPGHIEFMRGLKRLGILSKDNVKVGGCPVTPASLLAEVLLRSNRGKRDIVLLRVEVWGDKGGAAYTSLTRPRDGWSAMSIATGSVQASIVLLVARGLLRESTLVYPEHIGLRDHLSQFILDRVTSMGVSLTESYSM